MKSTNTAKLLALFIIIINVIFILSLAFDINTFTNSNKDFQLSTSIAFLFVGIIIYLVSNKKENSKKILSATNYLFSFFLVMILITNYLKDLFSKKVIGAFYLIQSATISNTTTLKISPITISGFVLILVAGFFKIYEAKNLNRKFYIIGLFLIVLALLAIVGHLFNIPFLYYSFLGENNSIGFYTALLFLLAGISILFLWRSTEVEGIGAKI